MFVKLGYSLQGNTKTLKGVSQSCRNAQFEYINTKTTNQIATRKPVISMGTKKELLCDYKNNGLTWQPKSTPTRVKSDNCSHLIAKVTDGLINYAESLNR